MSYEVAETAIGQSYPVQAVGSNASLDRQEGLNIPGPGTSLSRAHALVYEHPDFSANIKKWRKYTNCYEAEDMSQYIFQHVRESDDIYAQRIQRGYYYNYVASVVDLFVAYLFHAPITRNMEMGMSEEDWTEIQKDVNRCGDTFDAFIQTMATFAQITGHCGVLVDMPRIEESLESEEERKEKKIRPYLTLVRAEQILDWELDDDGNFEWVKIETFRPQGRTWMEAVDTVSRTFVIWTKESWEEWKVTVTLQDEDQRFQEATMLASGENPLGRVPLVIVRNERCITHVWFGLSAVRDISDINIGILNWSSLGDEEIYERCLNVLAIESSGRDAPVDLSHHNILEFEPGATPPFYLAPGTSPLEMIERWTKQARDEIYRLAKMGGLAGIKGTREATSGIAYAFEFNETNQALAKKAESLQQAEIEIHRLLCAWMGQDWAGSIIYPKEFGVEDFLTELQVLTEARTTLTSDTAIKELEVRVVNKMYSREKQELRDKMKVEIEAADPKGPGVVEGFSNAFLPASPSGSSGKSSEK